jgi:toxin ParE1/3/4
MRARFLDEAKADVAEATLWYEERSPGLGDDFHDAVEAAIGLIRTAPERFPLYEAARSSRKFRRIRLKRFPYYIAYEVRNDEILIVSVSHVRRRPGYWRNR